MAIIKISIAEFISLQQNAVVIDVRSPLEFAKAHIPNAISVSLFTDEERAVVGTAYKKEGRQKAIKIGLTYYGNKMLPIVEKVEQILQEKKLTNTYPLIIHCWRGGMRSAAVAWLLDLYGFKIYTIVGGYKAYRKWVQLQFEKQYPLLVLGGYTGSGKTSILKALEAKNKSIIDLENLACHKGSAFGKLGMPDQPTQEMFENNLATALHELYTIKTPLIIWVEAESQRIGNVIIPNMLNAQIRNSRVIFIDIPFSERLQNIVAEYGIYDTQDLIDATKRIEKRLGGLETKNAINFLIEKDIKSCFEILLKYYDKWYIKSTENRDNPTQQIQQVVLPTTNAEANAKQLLELI